MTPSERKALIALSKQESGDPNLDAMVKGVVQEKLLQNALKA